MSELYHYNHNHDPKTGQFTTSHAARSAARKINRKDRRRAHVAFANEHTTRDYENYKSWLEDRGKDHSKRLLSKIYRRNISIYEKYENKYKDEINKLIKQIDRNSFDVNIENIMRPVSYQQGNTIYYTKRPGIRVKVKPKK